MSVKIKYDTRTGEITYIYLSEGVDADAFMENEHLIRAAMKHMSAELCKSDMGNESVFDLAPGMLDTMHRDEKAKFR
jgi:hypothetical protein